MKFIKKYIVITAKKKPPKKPEKVLFGLIRVNFGPLKIFPKIYPPISVEIQIIIMNKKIIKPCSSKLLLKL